ncbi:putative nuclear pore complex protein [Sesbania bispinosa]|nr:putative nuclear pore complex protein [Sesbania bispinosa]
MSFSLTPASYSTNWADLHPDSQKFLLQIEERILEYRDESQRLDQCSRLYDSSISNDGFELDASHIVQELGGISTAMERQKTLLQELMSVVKDMLHNTEVAVRSFMMLRPRFLHPSGGASSATAPSQTPGATTSTQPTSTSIVPVFDFYSGLPKKPSAFIQQTVLRFEKYLGECHQWIEELEQLLFLDSERNASSTGSSLLQSLPKVMTNVHDFFVHVAAKVESIHQYIESMKSAYLANQRRRGEVNDPFLEADRRETARQEAASKRVHPTLHLPANSQPSTQVAGLFSSSGTQGALTAPQTSAATSSSSSGSGFSLFSTPSSAPSSSLFTTPATPAPGSSWFASSSATPQTSVFGSTSSSLPGVASTPSLFSNTAPLFSSTPAAGSLFSTPFASGAATGSGASFGPGSVCKL